MTATEQKRHAGSLHSHKENVKTRLKVLGELAQKDISILLIYVDKSRVPIKMHKQKHVLYNQIVAELLARAIRKRIIVPNDFVLVASRRETYKYLNAAFVKHLKVQKMDVTVVIKTPTEEKSLQLVDMISWSAFRKYEHGDMTYYDLIKQKIADENPLFE